MRVDFLEISNYPKIHTARIDIAETQTLFVGANNSGKTSAMVALRQFLKKGWVFDKLTASSKA